MKHALVTILAAVGFAAGALADMISLPTLTRNITLTRDTTLRGTLPENVGWKISIADGVTVTLENASLHGDWSHDPRHSDVDWAALTCLGDATIVLVGNNSVEGYQGSPGIYVPEGKTLTIQGKGALVATGGDISAAIGGGANLNCGNIVIKSGTITATAEASGGAGIGGYRGCSCGDIVIEGGNVTAVGGSGQAGIGGGSSAYIIDDPNPVYGVCGDIIIRGGTVNATGSLGGAAIGSGREGYCGDIFILGAKVTATSHYPGAGIGSGQDGWCGNISIGGSDVTATGSVGGAAIGSGRDGECGDVEISSGTIKATAIGGRHTTDPDGEVYCGAAIGCGLGGACVDVILRGGVISAIGDGDVVVGADSTGECYDINIDIGVSRFSITKTKQSGEWLSSTFGSILRDDGIIMTQDDKTRVYTWDGDLSTRTCDVTAFDGMSLYGTLSGNYKVSIEDGATVTLSGITINGVSSKEYNFAGLNLLGDATLILSGGKVNTVSGFYHFYPGVHVPSGCKLKITGSGTLQATSGGGAGGVAAGIGASYAGDYHYTNGACGDIEINGGVVIASGGNGAAGIGCAYAGTCGNIKISAGITRVVATAGKDGGGQDVAQPIGNGWHGSGATVTVEDGMDDTTNDGTRTIMPVWDGNLSTLGANAAVTAYDGMTLFGTLNAKGKISIAAGATVTLRGVTILVDGVENDTSCKWAGINCLGDATIVLEGNSDVRGFHKDYPGIYVPQGSTLTIKGSGSLDASSNGSGAGIGGGYNIPCGSIDIRSGYIDAEGGSGAAAIGGGGGTDASCGNIRIRASVTSVRADVEEYYGCEPIGPGVCKYGGKVTFDPGTKRVYESLMGDIRRLTITWSGNLSLVTADVTALSGTVITGTLDMPCKVSIADGATVTVSDAVINGYDSAENRYAGLTCLGSATINLQGNNIIRGFHHDYPGIYVPAGNLLTIQGGGRMSAYSNGCGAGIGGGCGIDCGEVAINGGNITAVGGMDAAGIGGGSGALCGMIRVNSEASRVVATSGPNCANPIGKGTGGTGGAVSVASTLVDRTSESTRTIYNNRVNLALLGGDFIAEDGMTLYGTLENPYKISIADGATVTLGDVDINYFYSEGEWSEGEWAGLTCLGDARLVLEGTYSNQLGIKGFGYGYPGIYVPYGKTLTIRGDGYLYVEGQDGAAGIGGGYRTDCGNIIIDGGFIDVYGGKYAAGIGSGFGDGDYFYCGDITINGGTIDANGGFNGAGIGSSTYGRYGKIEINGGTIVASGKGLAAGIGCGADLGEGGRIDINAGITTVIARRGTGSGSKNIGGEFEGQSVTVNVAPELRDVETENERYIDTVAWDGDLGGLAAGWDYAVATNGATIHGTLAANALYKIGISSGATVTISNAIINGVSRSDCKWAGITCYGDATIILEGESRIRGFYAGFPGIYVPPGCTLTIKGSGYLEAKSSGDAPGIGGASSLDCGNIRIEGGDIRATGGNYSAGIGSCVDRKCGWIVIEKTAQRVIAEHGLNCVNNIGAGDGGSGGEVTVMPGLSDVTTWDGSRRTIQWDGDLGTLDFDAVAFGGTVIHGTLASARKVSIADNAFVTVSNATIMVDGGNNNNYEWAGLTCLSNATIAIKGVNTIQGFYEDYPGIYVPKYSTLTIKGDGELTARGSMSSSGDRWSAGIGGGWNIPCGNIIVMGGTIYATGGRYAAGIGGGSGGNCGSIRIGAGISRVVATCHASCPTPIGNGGGSSAVANVTVAHGLEDDEGSPTRTIFSWWDGNLATVDSDMDVPDGMTLYGTLRESYKLTIEDGAHITLNNANINDMGTLSGSWAALTCAGSAGITLKGVSTVEGFSDYYPGIYVPPGNELVIQGDGTLESTGGSSAAGIGAGVNQDCGAILIEVEDGTIYAHGGSQSAGIGGTSTGNCEFIGIYGGEIEANGGAGGAGVGGGGSGECGPIEIGGAVILYAVGNGIGPSGIGSGTRGACEGVVIYGDADVTATGSSNGAGIGSGLEGSCGYVEISGGNVNATGGQYAAGIGAGRSGTCDDVTIARGITKVQATCGTSGTPISADAVSVRDGLLDDEESPTRTIMGWNGDLAALTCDVTVPTGMTIYGTLGGKYKVSIAARAKVTVSNATIVVTGGNSTDYKYAGLTCLGNAEITLKGVNQIRGFYENYPGIFVPKDSTLTIKGDGRLVAWSNGWGSGIGGGYNLASGSVSILGGIITAMGGKDAAGIGSGHDATCQDIYIGGSDVAAYGGINAAGIGSGKGTNASCDSIEIEGKVSVVASHGTNAPNAIGAGLGATCYNAPVISSTLYDDLGEETRTITVWNGDLSLLKKDITVLSGTKMYGTLGGPYKVTIDSAAKVTISNATIMVADVNSQDYEWAGLNCFGSAELTLEGENRIRGFYEDYPGIHVPQGSTLTIKGSGSLEASSNGYGAGIGGGWEIPCGNITIEGGTINATGGGNAAGIGSGGGDGYGWGTITIRQGITRVVATAGQYAPEPIGRGYSAPSSGDNSGEVILDGEFDDEMDGLTRTIIPHSAMDPLAAYKAWATANGVTGDWDAVDAYGIANVFRYAFNLPTGDFDILGITFDEYGYAVVLTQPIVNVDDTFVFTIVASDNPDGVGAVVEHPLDPSGVTVIGETPADKRFFNLHAVKYKFVSPLSWDQ